MKVWKLVSGILSIILFVFVSFQSCAAGLSNALEANGEASGTAGIMVAVFMLAGGIVSIATRKAKGKGGNIALIILFGIAALVGFTNYGSYSDLAIWSGWCLINAVLAVIAMITGKKKIEDESGSELTK
ncbi:MAG: hypothetical protein MSA91_06205 [Lachnobacterium sp.]|nr:hypothetical protein [Lachnobacterium sp.]MDD6631821.1 hypothetical protein [Lachnobacterium sp.]MDY2912733.1 hypothetical protein [Agathobacter sp.]